MEIFLHSTLLNSSIDFPFCKMHVLFRNEISLPHGIKDRIVLSLALAYEPLAVLLHTPFPIYQRLYDCLFLFFPHCSFWANVQFTPVTWMPEWWVSPREFWTETLGHRLRWFKNLVSRSALPPNDSQVFSKCKWFNPKEVSKKYEAVIYIEPSGPSMKSQISLFMPRGSTFGCSDTWYIIRDLAISRETSWAVGNVEVLHWAIYSFEKSSSVAVSSPLCLSCLHIFFIDNMKFSPSSKCLINRRITFLLEMSCIGFMQFMDWYLPLRGEMRFVLIFISEYEPPLAVVPICEILCLPISMAI